MFSVELKFLKKLFSARGSQSRLKENFFSLKLFINFLLQFFEILLLCACHEKHNAINKMKKNQMYWHVQL